MEGKWRDLAVSDIAAPIENALATGPFGSSISSKFFQDHGVPVIRGSNLTDTVRERLVEAEMVFVSHEKADELRRSIARRGDLVFTCWGTIGQVGLVDERAEFGEYLVSNKQMKLTPDPTQADSLFLYYLFSSPSVSSEIKNQAIGSSVPGFNLGQLKRIRLHLPPLAEQQTIAHILGSFDDKIELNRRMNETLEGMARALFKSWFVDFDPVRAKMDGRWQAGESLPGLPAELYHMFPDRLVDSELGEVPEGWAVSTIAAVAELNPTNWSKTNAPASVRYVDLGNTKFGSIDQVTEYEWEEAPSRARRILQPWDTILGTVRPANGSFGLVLQSGLTGSTGFAVLRAVNASHRAFVYLAVTQESNIGRLARLAHGAAYPAVRGDVVAATPAVLPSLELAEAFAARVDPFFERIAAERLETVELTAIREALLPKLISGEIRVPPELVRTPEV